MTETTPDTPEIVKLKRLAKHYGGMRRLAQQIVLPPVPARDISPSALYQMVQQGKVSKSVKQWLDQQEEP